MPPFPASRGPGSNQYRDQPPQTVTTGPVPTGMAAAAQAAANARALFPRTDVHGFAYGTGTHAATGGDRDPDGFDRDGNDPDGYDRHGRDRWGFHRDGTYGHASAYGPRHDQHGFDARGIHHATGTDRDPDGYDREGVDVRGFDPDGWHRTTGQPFDELGFDRDAIHHETGTVWHPDGFDRDGRWQDDS